MSLEELEFRLDDFEKCFRLAVKLAGAGSIPLNENWERNILLAIVFRANSMLSERLEKAPIVSGGRKETGGGESWRFHEDERAYPWDVTHTARLVCIEETGVTQT